jgi:flagellar basal-body rod protein FlgB
MTGMPSQYQLLSNAIEFANQNHRAISQNLANVNTPNYESQQLSFEQFLKHVETARPEDGTGNKQFELQNTPGLASRSDGNNVDLDRELANLKKNDLAHTTLTQLLGSQIKIMKKAIVG